MDTPISVLQDFCYRNLDGCNPEYQLMSVEGVVHAPTFMYRVQIGDVVANAVGNSKKKAKHGAALNALESLLKRFPEAPEHSTFVNKISLFSEETQVKKVAEQEETQENDLNPVGKLQEICMKKRWRPPTYDTIEEIGLPHERVFTMTCQIEHTDVNVKVTGRGKSKKQAKRSAAHEMIAKLESLNICHADLTKQTDKHYEKQSQIKQIDNGIKLTLNCKDSVDLFYRELGDELNKEVDGILVDKSSSHLDYCKNLQTVADYVECKVDYTFYGSVDTQAVCLASLIPSNTYKFPVPIVTGWGTKKSKEEAKQNAAQVTLELFRELKQILDTDI